jgi:hypothetical protein
MFTFGSRKPLMFLTVKEKLPLPSTSTFNIGVIRKEK